MGLSRMLNSPWHYGQPHKVVQEVHRDSAGCKSCFPFPILVVKLAGACLFFSPHYWASQNHWFPEVLKGLGVVCVRFDNRRARTLTFMSRTSVRRVPGMCMLGDVADVTCTKIHIGFV
jgi:hypothetical protein